MSTHKLPPELLRRSVKVALVGAGGTGSRVIENLANLHRAMLALGHPYGLEVTVFDDDVVTQANIGRQAFYPSDAGAYKAFVLVNRVNMALGGLAHWSARLERITTKTSGFGQFDLVIGAVDNRSARLAILRAMEASGRSGAYWLDMGNRASDGQVVLGQVVSKGRKTDDVLRLPHAAEFFPELIRAEADREEDDTPSCSLAEALRKQSLYVNPMMAVVGCNLLWELFTTGEIAYQGAFVNLKHSTVLPIPADPKVWEQMGVVRNGRRQPVKRQKKKEAVPA